MSSSSAKIEHEDQVAEQSPFEVDLDNFASDSSWLAPPSHGDNSSTSTNVNVVIDDDGATTSATSQVASLPYPGNSALYENNGNHNNEQEEDDFRSLLRSTLLPAVTSLAASSVESVRPTGSSAPATNPPPTNTPTEVFSVEKEQAEIESLTVDEILDAERDLTGLSRGMDKMSLQQQQGNVKVQDNTTAWAQIHEDPVATPADLAALELALLALPPETKRYYLEACVRCPAEITDERKAAFLETEQLDATAAATRLCKYWTVRVETFGSDLAYLPMTLNGAMREDVDSMIRYCPMQRLPKTDAYGRQMTFWDSGRRNSRCCTLEQEHRGMFYLVHTMTLDPTSRRRGWVAIATGKNQKQSNFSWETAQYLKGLYSTVMPIKMRSCHVSHPSNVLYYGIYPVLKGIIGREMRLRWKLYPSTTTDEELMDQLATYGIPRSRLPVDIGGDLRLDFEQFIADYSVLESLTHMDNEEEKSKKPATSSTKSPAQPSLSSLLAHPQLLSTSSTPPPLPSSADDMLTVDQLRRAASGMPATRPPSFPEDAEADVARSQVLSKFSSQLLMAGALAGSRRTSSLKDEDDSRASTGGKPLALLATTLSTPVQQSSVQMSTTNNPRDPLSSLTSDDDLDSFDIDLDQMQNIEAS